MTLVFLFSVCMMLGLFLMLYAGVGLIQDNRFFTTAPKIVQEVIIQKDERFPGAHALGWFLAALSVIMMLGPLVWAGVDGFRSGFGFSQFFFRYLFMFLALKAFDILFFDLVLLCHSNFFPRFYPESAEYLGPHLFGFNWKEHAVHIAASPVLSALLAFVCTLF